MRNTKIREEWAARMGTILALKESGATNKEVGKQFGVSAERIRQVLNLYGHLTPKGGSGNRRKRSRRMGQRPGKSRKRQSRVNLPNGTAVKLRDLYDVLRQGFCRFNKVSEVSITLLEGSTEECTNGTFCIFEKCTMVECIRKTLLNKE